MPSRPPIAILTAHGQPSSPEKQERALSRLADAVAPLLPDWDVRSATLSTPDRLETQAEDGALIYPFFMAQGYFASTVLTKRLKHVTHHLLSPFGLDPALPQMVAQALENRILPTQAGCSTLLLAAHGSARGQRAAEAANGFAEKLKPLLPNLQIRVGFIEEAPYVRDAARGMPKDTLCLPFFAQEGDHVRVDVPEALEEADFFGQILPSVGAFPETPRLIARAILASGTGTAG